MSVESCLIFQPPKNHDKAFAAQNRFHRRKKLHLSKEVLVTRVVAILKLRKLSVLDFSLCTVRDHASPPYGLTEREECLSKPDFRTDFPCAEILNEAFNDWAAHPDSDLAPHSSAADITKWNDVIYDTVNNGVYKCGFATTQASVSCSQMRFSVPFSQADVALVDGSKDKGECISLVKYLHLLSAPMSFSK